MQLKPAAENQLRLGKSGSSRNTTTIETRITKSTENLFQKRNPHLGRR